MKYKNITVQWEDFDEVFEVVKKLNGQDAYMLLATFKEKKDAIEWAKAKAKSLSLPLVDESE